MQSTRPIQRQALVAFAFGCLLVCSAYWVGLRGPLLLDDVPNLADVVAWLDGQRTWQSAMFNNRSGIGGRPLSMASFILDGALWGGDVWHFKLTNLVVHLLCGIALLGLNARLVTRDSALRAHASWLPVALTLVWLSLPIQVSSVLYVVQRMAMLSALSILLSLWVFMLARERIEQGHRGGHALLWLLFPALVAAGALCKENAVLAAPLALILELAYFRPTNPRTRSSSVRTFFALTVVLPALAVCAWLILRPDWLPASYASRDFTLWERLLTQPRALWDYVRSIFVPFGPALGVFHDDYPKSTGWLVPWTTLPAILGWTAVLAAAWWQRRNSPAILTGVALYLVGHAMESGALPLELYFEHRNYLPSFGLSFAAAGILDAGIRGMGRQTPAFRAVVATFPLLLLVVYVSATHGRARVWSSLDTLYVQELRYNPDSPRLRSFLAADAMRKGDVAQALQHIAVAERTGRREDIATTSLWKLLAHCAGKRTPQPGLYGEYDARARGPVTMYAAIAWEQLVQKIEQQQCPGIDIARLSAATERWLAATPTPRAAHAHWRMRYYLARTFAYQSDFARAIRQGQRSWVDSGYNDGVGVFLFQVNASAGNLDACRKILARLAQASGGGDLALDDAVTKLRAGLHELEQEHDPTSSRSHTRPE